LRCGKSDADEVHHAAAGTFTSAIGLRDPVAGSTTTGFAFASNADSVR
jgi:hypothetical protein